MTLEAKIDLLMRMQICKMDNSQECCCSCPYAKHGRPNCDNAGTTCRTKLLLDAAKALNGKDRDEREEYRIRDAVADILLDVGVPAHGKGYPMLVEIITYIVANPEVEGEKIYSLYATVAEKFDATAKIVERNIRAAIERAADRYNEETMVKYFGNSIRPDKDHPTNREFIYRIVDFVRRELRSMD